MTANYEVAVQQHRFDLLLKDGALVALIETVDEGDRLLIENVAVASGLQGQGLGQMLLAHAEHLARDLGKTRIRLYTNQRLPRTSGSTNGSATASTAKRTLGSPWLST